MKHLIKSWALAACLTSTTVVTLALVGCAGDRYERSTGEYIDDKTIATKVKSDLFADKSVSGFAVKVESYKGVVQLSGFVDTAAQKNRAGEIARGVKGVKEVKNNIIVK